MREREYGVDLFRCIGLLFVNALHACLYNGFYYETQQGIGMFFANSFRWLFYGCNSMFMLMTGYLKSGSKWGKGYYKSLVAVIVGYVLTCIISYPIRYFCIGEKDGLGVWVQRLFTFSNYAWYVEMYIGLILISPILNAAVNHMDSKKQLYLLVLSMVFITSLPAEIKVTGPDGSYALIPDYWSSLYPITLYLIGAVIRKTKPDVPCWAGLTVAALTAAGLGLTSLFTTGGKFSSGYTTGYGGLWIMVMVTALFLGIYRLKLPSKAGKALAWISGGVFEGYILSRLLDVWIYGTVKQWHDPRYYWLIFVCITIPVFLVSLTAGKIVNTVSAAITKGLYRLGDTIRQRLSRSRVP